MGITLEPFLQRQNHIATELQRAEAVNVELAYKLKTASETYGSTIITLTPEA